MRDGLWVRGFPGAQRVWLVEQPRLEVRGFPPVSQRTRKGRGTEHLWLIQSPPFPVFEQELKGRDDWQPRAGEGSALIHFSLEIQVRD